MSLGHLISGYYITFNWIILHYICPTKNRVSSSASQYINVTVLVVARKHIFSDEIYHLAILSSRDQSYKRTHVSTVGKLSNNNSNWGKQMGMSGQKTSKQWCIITSPRHLIDSLPSLNTAAHSILSTFSALVYLHNKTLSCCGINPGCHANMLSKTIYKTKQYPCRQPHIT